MLPILNKPLLQFGVEEALSAGITNMAIVTGRGKRAIEDHFDNAFELESQLNSTKKDHLLSEITQIIKKSTFTYVRQQQMLGLGHAILTGEPLIGNEPFAVVLADDLCDCEENGVLSQMIKTFNEYNCSIVAIQEVPMNQVNQYGIITGNPVPNSNNLFLVTDLIEKPQEENAPSNMAIVGRYILTPEIFNILKNTNPDEGGEIQITDALKIQAKQGKVIALKFKGKRFDCGSISGFLEATNHFAHKMKINK